jgi:hypothetical protein
MTTLAMFPLGKVLVPGEALPLHVFEPRYRQLVIDLLAADGPPEFGVVLIERGWEVGGGDDRTTVGTIARVLDVHALPDGRYALVAVGVRRLRVERWLPDDPYPRAVVTEWPDEIAPDDEAALTAALSSSVARLRAVYELAARAGSVADVPDLDVERFDPVLASYRLVASAPIGPADAYRALCTSGPLSRLEALAASLDDAEAVLRFQLGEP